MSELLQHPEPTEKNRGRAAVKSLGIDIGTTSICLVCYEEGREKLLFTASRQNEFLPGTFEQDPEAIVEKVKDMLAEAERNGFGAGTADTMDSSAADSIGISSQMHGILYVDADGCAVSPFYTWKDEKGRELMEDGRSYEACLSQSLGMPVFSGFGTVTHFCLSRKGLIPGKAVKLANIGDYVAMRLTGRKSPLTDESIAASFGGYDVHEGDFAREKLEQAGVDISYYPELCRQGEAAGTYQGIPVSCAFGDNQASFYGALDKPETQISVNVGTGSQVSLFDSRYYRTAAADIRPYFHKGCLYVGASLNGGKVYEKLAAFFEEIVYEFTGQNIQAFDQMARLGAEKKETGLMITPSLYGKRGEAGSGADAYGTVKNLTADDFHASDFIRAYVKGMADELYRMYLEFPEEIRRGRTEIVASGNGVRKNLLMAEETAKVFGLPVIFKDTQEEAAAGAAKAALDLLA